MSILNRFPSKEQIIPVYAVGITMLYSWAIFTTIKDFTRNWVLFFSIPDIFNLFTYVFVGTFLESLILIGSLLFISFLFPQIILNDRFILYGTVLTMTFLSSLIYLYSQTLTLGVLENIDQWIIFFLITTIVFLFLGEKVKIFQKTIILIANNSVIFLYVYLPISFLSIVFVFARNLR